MNGVFMNRDSLIIFLKDIIFIYHNAFYWLYTKGHISFDNCKHLFQQEEQVSTWFKGWKFNKNIFL